MNSRWLWGTVDFFRHISESTNTDLDSWSFNRPHSISVFAHILHCRLITEVSSQSINVIGMIASWVTLMSSDHSLVSQTGLIAFWLSIFLRSLAYQISASAFILSSGDEFLGKENHYLSSNAKNRFNVSRKIKAAGSLSQRVGLYALAIVFMRKTGWYHW